MSYRQSTELGGCIPYREIEHEFSFTAGGTRILFNDPHHYEAGFGLVRVFYDGAESGVGVGWNEISRGNGERYDATSTAWANRLERLYNASALVRVVWKERVLQYAPDFARVVTLSGYDGTPDRTTDWVESPTGYRSTPAGPNPANSNAIQLPEVCDPTRYVWRLFRKRRKVNNARANRVNGGQWVLHRQLVPEQRYATLGGASSSFKRGVWRFALYDTLTGAQSPLSSQVFTSDQRHGARSR